MQREALEPRDLRLPADSRTCQHAPGSGGGDRRARLRLRAYVVLSFSSLAIGIECPAGTSQTVASHREHPPRSSHAVLRAAHDSAWMALRLDPDEPVHDDGDAQSVAGSEGDSPVIEIIPHRGPETARQPGTL